jgi:hypothetical protein
MNSCHSLFAFLFVLYFVSENKKRIKLRQSIKIHQEEASRSNNVEDSDDEDWDTDDIIM